MTEQEAGGTKRCARCERVLSEARVVLSVVYGADGPVLEACGMACLTQLVAALARKATQGRQYAEGVRT